MMLPWLTGEAAENQRRQIATRAIFFLAGLGMAAWAPLIPFVKARLGIDDGALGLLLFCLAAGSMAIMPFAGYLIAKLGCRAVLLGAGALLCIDLPLLALLDAPLLMGAALGVFGAVNGIMDVAMNSQAIIVERESGQAKMSGFHGFYSLGGIAGAGGVSLLLLAGLAPTQAIGLIALLIAILLLIVAGDLLAHGGIGERRRGGARWALAHGKILFIALLCFFVFLTEGAMLDWSALFLHAERGVAKSQSGIGFTLYAVAVACGRLYGDRLIGAVGRSVRRGRRAVDRHRPSGIGRLWRVDARRPGHRQHRSHSVQRRRQSKTGTARPGVSGRDAGRLSRLINRPGADRFYRQLHQPGPGVRLHAAVPVAGQHQRQSRDEHISLT